MVLLGGNLLPLFLKLEKKLCAKTCHHTYLSSFELIYIILADKFSIFVITKACKLKRVINCKHTSFFYKFATMFANKKTNKYGNICYYKREREGVVLKPRRIYYNKFALTQAL